MSLWRNFWKFDLFWCLVIALACYTASGLVLVTEIAHYLVSAAIFVIGAGFQIYARWRWPPEHDRRYHARNTR